MMARSAANRFPTAIAIIGDMVASRKVAPSRRKQVQLAFQRLILHLNQKYENALTAKFNIALGDEFEGLIDAASGPRVIPDLIWMVEKEFPSPQLRLGIGHGPITAEMGEFASAWDGPAFHRAREAIDLAAKKKQLGGLFRGFGESHDLVLNGLARLLRHQRERWSPQQRQAASLLHKGHSQIEVAGMMKVSKQAISAYARAAGWSAYEEGETALRATLEEALPASRAALQLSAGERYSSPAKS